MFGHDHRQDDSRIAQLRQSLRSLEPILARAGRLASNGSRDTVESVYETVGTALGEMADRIREGAANAGAAVLPGRRAASLAKNSVARVAGQGIHPLMIVGIAIGIGALVGAARYRSSAETPPARPRKRTRSRKGPRR